MKKLCLVLSLSLMHFASIAQVDDKPNIIIIVFDDLNDWVNNFEGHPQTSTPNLNAISLLGTTFKNAHASAPVCAPSRTSWLTGKNPSYTGVYNNEEFDDTNFRANFPDDKYILTLPQYLKDSAGYYTASLNKVFHNEQNLPDYDELAPDNCSRQLSWNEVVVTENQGGLISVGGSLDEDIDLFDWAMVNDSFLTYMQDYTVVNEAATLLNNYEDNPEDYCNKPLFLSIGFHKPHLQLYIPEQFFLPYYKINFFETPYTLPYNYPDNQFPYNGVVMPPQPPNAYEDYDSLGFVGKKLAAPSIHNQFADWGDSMAALIDIDDSLSYNATSEILYKSKMANAVMAYLAAVKFADAQLGRLWDSLNEHPDILNNSIVIITSDHGYALDEKKHWKKNTLWETDIRVPFFVIDMRNIDERTSYMPVSLLDIFPTVCEYVGVDLPKNEFGLTYTDGKSIKQLVENTEIFFESPSLTTYKADSSKQAGCFEQFSVRNERFHYLEYHSNNIDGDLSCNLAASITEQELYEIGEFRDVDPNEWNNIAYKSDYLPVKQFLTQFLPGKALYTSKTIKPKIAILNPECQVNNGDTIHFYFDLFDTTGLLISPPENYKYIWSSNFSDEIHIGTNYNCVINNLADLSLLENVIIYLQIEDTIAHITRGFDLTYINLNGNNPPEFEFTATLNNSTNTASITNITYPTDLNTVFWDFGDGYVFYGATPPNHTYTNYGTYTIECNLTYGETTPCAWKEGKQITTIEKPEVNTLFIFPNPVSTELNYATTNIISEYTITISNAIGQVILSNFIANNELLINSVNIADLNSGVYHFTLTTKNMQLSNPFIKL